MSNAPDTLIAVILAGGRATRMGGSDKGWIPLRGKPLICHVQERLAPQVDGLLINANRNLARYQALAPVVSDTLGDYPGPLAGMLAGLEAATSEWVLFVPCDTPFLPRDLVSRLQAARTPECEVVVAHDGEWLQPVVALVKRSLRGSLAATLAAGERRIDRWYARHTMVLADFSDCPHAFDNLNSPDELARHDSN
ncbi:molybdenum cofactor guanylyltransferase MobA [Aeromonas schubertii]|uniref:Molybdenum cofactor guanylyltransferase n=1 Tax=Aeromonas schubertii TaxID=652 RepID=A0ABS7V761_9GAMM|nr:molybdenum cofactor guanylyltransferase MobA [Aeromonas schubertii]MBZ6065239.1 molybdenum cofactor guanylyltransferase [Aeromonas schubertii]MBZ6071508.1 molybdenum cofactor guanylyltransferase [Aeromonas schubertii]